MAQLLPEEKVDAVMALKEEFGLVGMVGDGVNDARLWSHPTLV